MRLGWIPLAGAVLFAAGCNRAPLKGGSRIAEDVYWRLNALGEGERTPSDSDSVLMRVRMARPGMGAGSWYSTERWYPMGGARAVNRFFGRMRQGDSATVLLPAAQAPWAELGAAVPARGSDTGWVQVELSLREVRSLGQSRALARAVLDARTATDEERTLNDFFAKDPRHWKQAMGVWYTLDPGAEAGMRVQSGDLVTLAYAASFLDNGKVFDDQTRKGGGITFRLGDPGQVIKGLEVAAHLLPAKGGGGVFVIPAELAFGPAGSSSGIVPPWTPVLYRVEVVPRAAARP